MGKPSSAKSEWLTRKQLVDKELCDAGWRVTPYHGGVALSRFDRCAVQECPTSDGPADYVLALPGCVVGVVEAKKLSLGHQDVLSHAERYSRGVDGDGSFGEFGVLFLYSTKGEVIWYHDVRQTLIDMPVELPGLEEQKVIVERARALLRLAEHLEAHYAKATAQIARLIHSVLTKAFRGELMPTESELAQREGREYETAELVLDRAMDHHGTGGAARKASRTKRLGSGKDSS